MATLYKKFLSVLIITLIMVGFFAVNSSAANADETVKNLQEHNNKIICIAHRGDWHNYPENSIEAINSARQFDAISVDVKLTSDGKPVLMADNTVDRMCVDESGKSVSGEVSAFTAAEIQSFFLRERNGSADKNPTSYRVASLEDALISVGNNSALVLNVSLDDFDAAYKVINSSNSVSNVVFRIDGSIKKILEKTKDLSPAPVITGNYQGNIIFLAVSAVKECTENSVNTIELGSANGHGVLYDNFLMKRFDENGKAMVSMVNGRCGKRTDNETGWDDLISRGYSVIETDYPQELTQYISRLENSALELKRYIDLYKNTDLAAYTTDTENAFNSAMDNANSELTRVSSLSELDSARYSLQSSFDHLTTGQKKAVTLAFNFSAGRIVAAVLCAAALVISQILLARQRVRKKK